MRVLFYALVGLLLLVVAQPAPTQAQGSCAFSREDAIITIAHYADVVYGGRVNKWRIWEIADRESGLNHCINGRVKIGVTGDHGLLQYNPAGIWRNCLINRHCNHPRMIDDPIAQIEAIMNYYMWYGDLCPWNPYATVTNGGYLPGCGYR